jgi:Fe-S-cluster containining protein
MSNPCVSCGACCAHFRVTFYWAEADPATGGVTPPALTIKLSPHHAVMRGTEGRTPRCAALLGTLGEEVACTIYAQRPSPCREFQASWVDGVHNARCDRARAAHGLPPLSPPGDSR